MSGVERERIEAEKLSYKNHLAAIAEEALRIEGDQFIHTNLQSFKEAVKAKIASGTDKRLISYRENSFIGQMRVAGYAIQDFGVIPANKNTPISEIIKDERRFEKMVPNSEWRKFFINLSASLPEDTTSQSLAILLIHFKELISFKSVKERLAQRRNQFPLPTD